MQHMALLTYILFHPKGINGNRIKVDFFVKVSDVRVNKVFSCDFGNVTILIDKYRLLIFSSGGKRLDGVSQTLTHYL